MYMSSIIALDSESERRKKWNSFSQGHFFKASAALWKSDSGLIFPDKRVHLVVNLTEE